MNVFILSLSSDIGSYLARHYLALGHQVFGTHRSPLGKELSEHANLTALSCDVARSEAAADIRQFLENRKLVWDLWISCVGVLDPVGPFAEVQFDDWRRSFEVNSTAQLGALHASLPFRQSRPTAHVVFFAGGGTNGPFPGYSAYCLGKIALIKMSELLDDEMPDLNVFIVGTGWVRTKIHDQTLQAGRRAGVNLERTNAFLQESAAGTSMADIAAMIDWGVHQGRRVTGGRNFSVVHDAWREGGDSLAAGLRAHSGRFKLRREVRG